MTRETHSTIWILGVTILWAAVILLISTRVYQRMEAERIAREASAPRVELGGQSTGLKTSEPGTQYPQWDINPSSDVAALVYMLTSAASTGALLLVSGVLVLAPLVSLSLHQSHDAVFSLWREADTNGLRDVGSKCQHLLNRNQRCYELINRWLYYPVWALSVLAFCAVTFFLVMQPWLRIRLFFTSSVFLVVSALLCAAFGITALLTFLIVKPGEKKLELYSLYIKNQLAQKVETKLIATTEP